MMNETKKMNKSVKKNPYMGNKTDVLSAQVTDLTGNEAEPWTKPFCVKGVKYIFLLAHPNIELPIQCSMSFTQ